MYKKSLVIVGLFSIVLSVAGCSNKPSYLVGPEQTIQKNLSSGSLSESDLIIYRSENDIDNIIDESILVTHDNRVVGGLMPGQYLLSHVCYGENEVTLKTAKCYFSFIPQPK